MPFTIHKTQGDAIGPTGSLEVFLEFTDCEGRDPYDVVFITTHPKAGRPEAPTELAVRIDQLDTFYTALGRAIAEARRTGSLPAK